MFNNMLDESTEGREGEREGREKESIETVSSGNSLMVQWLRL